MKYTFIFGVSVRLELTKKRIEHLIQQSEIHYDFTCQSAGRHGGFIYGWRNQLELMALRNTNSVEIVTTFREIDTCCKILEMPGSDLCFAAELKEMLKLINEQYRRVNSHLLERQEVDVPKPKPISSHPVFRSVPDESADTPDRQPGANVV